MFASQQCTETKTTELLSWKLEQNDVFPISATLLQIITKIARIARGAGLWEALCET